MRFTLLSLVCLACCLGVFGSRSEVQIRGKRERKRLGSEEVCRLMAFNIPGLCGVVKLGLRWMMREQNVADYFGNVCVLTVALHQTDKRRKRETEKDFSEQEMASFIQEYGNSSASSSAVAEKKSTSKICQKLVDKTHNFCQWMLGKSVANNIRNFAWVCLFVPAANPFGVCYESVRQFGRICRAEAGDDTPDEPELKTPEEKSVSSVYSPIQTCKSFLPTFSALCGHFQNAFEFFFGAQARGALGKSCAVFFDGVKHYMPEIQKTLVPKGWIAKGWQKIKAFGGLSHVTNTTEDQTNDLQSAMVSNARALKVCSNAVAAMGQVCESILGRFSNSFSKLGGICVFSGPYFGECRFIVSTLQGMCQTQTNACDQSASAVGKFSCWKKRDGIYADTANPCANYYFQCMDFLPLAIPCREGPGFVYVESERRCRHKADVAQCHGVRSPCIPDSLELAKNQFSSDSSGSVATYASKSGRQQAKIVLPKTVTNNGFACSGKSGVLQDPSSECSPFFYICESGSRRTASVGEPEPVVKTCNVDEVERVYVEGYGCVPKYHACALRGIAPENCPKCYNA